MDQLPEVVDVKALGGYRLRLTFQDGVTGEIDLGTTLTFTGVFEPLRDVGEFAKVRVNRDTGTIEWPTGADQDPVVLYCRVTGQELPKAFRESA